jgi:predicted alpha/beta-fold hydrolase
VRAFDGSACEIYRRNVLLGLKEIYASVARRRPVPTSVADAARIRKIREWDDRIVAPRYGFADAAHYYRSVSVGPRLPDVAMRSLIVFAENDPMVPKSAVAESAERCGAATSVKWVQKGGHMAFSSELDLLCGGALGLEGQIMNFFRSAANGGEEVSWVKS